ncbi:restriction endonuclease [Streptococcus catagoni]|uniref:restriction endonuclease n=1 Tax=Streptococcus catagoni TaxID=2654874 RepID=UPI001407EF0D|nr:restriction endonuclease [Streptococcus catagoni]
MVNTGKKLEDYAQYVYSRLLELNDYENVLVSTKVKIKGQSGATNEFDVYYQFTHLNIECRVGIECKDWKKRVSVKEIRDFSTKLKDVGMGNMIGIMISQAGFQEGAKIFAESNGIKLMTVAELPTIVDVLSGVLKKGFLPDEKVKGEPFWMIMEQCNGEVTGSLYQTPNGNNGPATIPLFYSKNLAQLYYEKIPDKEKYCVRGVSRYQLKGLVKMAELMQIQFVLFPLPFSLEGTDLTQIIAITVSYEVIKKDYLEI